MSGDDPPDQWFAYTAGEKAFFYGALGTVVGTTIGILVGVLAKKTFIIKGKKEAFNKMQVSLYNWASIKPKKEY